MRSPSNYPLRVHLTPSSMLAREARNGSHPTPIVIGGIFEGPTLQIDELGQHASVHSVLLLGYSKSPRPSGVPKEENWIDSTTH